MTVRDVPVGTIFNVVIPNTTPYTITVLKIESTDIKGHNVRILLPPGHGEAYVGGHLEVSEIAEFKPCS